MEQTCISKDIIFFYDSKFTLTKLMKHVNIHHKLTMLMAKNIQNGINNFESSKKLRLK